MSLQSGSSYALSFAVKTGCRVDRPVGLTVLLFKASRVQDTVNQALAKDTYNIMHPDDPVGTIAGLNQEFSASNFWALEGVDEIRVPGDKEEKDDYVPVFRSNVNQRCGPLIDSIFFKKRYALKYICIDSKKGTFFWFNAFQPNSDRVSRVAWKRQGNTR